MASDGSKLLDLIADLDDETVIEKVIDRHGGSRVYVPANYPHASNWLVEIAGCEAAISVLRAFHGPSFFRSHQGGINVDLPLSVKSANEKSCREIRRRIKLGQSSNRIAIEVGVSRRTVQRHRARLKKLAQRNSVSRTEGPSE